MKQEEFDFIKDAFSQILDDIVGNPDWNDAALAISADLGALERELEGKVVSSDKSLEEAADTYAEKHGFRVPYDGSDNYYDEVDVKASKEGFIAGAEWAEKQIPISKDLYKASVEYSREPDEDGMEVFNAEKGVAFADGAEWQRRKDNLEYDDIFYKGMQYYRKQMMDEGIDCIVKEDAGGYPYIERTIELYDYVKDEPIAKKGDKYTLILIKNNGQSD